MSHRTTESIKRLKVSPTQKLVLFTLADCHNEQSGRCDPSYAYLMDITGLSNRAIADALKALADNNHITMHTRSGLKTFYTFGNEEPAPFSFPDLDENPNHYRTSCPRVMKMRVQLARAKRVRRERMGISKWKWSALQRIVFFRDDYICQYCRNFCENPHCDHVIPVSRGGSNELSNLVTSCRDCNLTKGSKLLNEWRPDGF